MHLLHKESHSIRGSAEEHATQQHDTLERVQVDGVNHTVSSLIHNSAHRTDGQTALLTRASQHTQDSKSNNCGLTAKTATAYMACWKDVLLARSSKLLAVAKGRHVLNVHTSYALHTEAQNTTLLTNMQMSTAAAKKGGGVNDNTPRRCRNTLCSGHAEDCLLRMVAAFSTRHHNHQSRS